MGLIGVSCSRADGGVTGLEPRATEHWTTGPATGRLGDWATRRVEERTLDDDGADKWKKWKGSMHLSA